MKISKVTAGKEFKCGLPNYSNITSRVEITFDIGEGEEPDWSEIWDTVNYEVSKQVEGTDPSWIETKEYNRFFKVTAKVPKK